jgi:hypothetical protein
VQLALQDEVDAQMDHVQQWDGSPLPSALRTRLKRAWQKVGFLTTHIQTLEAERRALLRRREDSVIDQVRQLFTLRGIGGSRPCRVRLISRYLSQAICVV